MKPQRPYLLRALYDWIVDSVEVPYVLVDATYPGVVVPDEHVKDGQIVLNIGPNAVRDLQLGDDYVMCNGRFDGRAFELCLPVPSIKAIYSKDTAQGMVFPEETVQDRSQAKNSSASDAQVQPAAEATAESASAEPQPNTSDNNKPAGPPNLRLV